jgi:uncharacterized membrane protein YphA (DoxX/SURF4 family)
MRSAGPGRGLFAVASAALAVWSLTYGDFAWGVQSALAGIPWREAWVYGSALIVLAASAGLCWPRTALASVLTIGAYQAIGAAISVPRILSRPLSIDAWYPFCEAVTPLAGAWVLYAMLRRRSRRSGKPVASEGSVRAAQILFGLTCVFYGWSHFLYADYTAGMVPAWLPGRLAFAYLTGLGHIAAGLAIVFGILPRLAATLEAIMMSSFGILVWVPSFLARPRPKWAVPPEHQWSELVVTLVLAASAWIVAISFADRPWAFASRSRAYRHPSRAASSR